MNTLQDKSAAMAWHKYAFGLLALVFLSVLLRTAWLSDDAFITYRCVNNLVEGHGFGFNAGQRVQAFTHPLWALLHVPLQASFENIYYPAIFLPMAISLLVMLLVWRLPLPFVQKVLLACAMIFSKSFIDYSSSGLENPLNHLLVLAFFFVWMREMEPKKKVLLVSLIAGLAVFNRMDMLLIFLPALAQLLWRKPSLAIFGRLFVGFLPFLLWEAFAIIYYGFAFPNTAYAKLNSGIPKLELWLQGLRYVQDLLLNDPMTFCFICIGLVAMILGRKKEYWALGIGILLYVLYTVNVGGDFMRGRFFTVPFLLAILLAADFSNRAQGQWRNVVWLPLVLGAFLSSGSTLFAWKNYGQGEGYRQSFRHGIADERAYYFGTTGLLNAEGEMPRHRWAEKGRSYRRDQRKGIEIVSAVGMLGYYASPEQTFVDLNALVDPLLARLPAYYNPEWRIGHFERLVPKGYIAALKKKGNHLTNPDIQYYHDRLQRVMSEEIWSWDRFKEIARFAIGKNEALLPEEQFRMPALAPIQMPSKSDSLRFNCNEGICIALPPGKFPKGMRLHSKCATIAYTLAIRKGAKLLWGQLVEPKPEEMDGIQVLKLSFPQEFEAELPDNVVLFPHDCFWRCTAWEMEWE